ncbi:MAG TPA: transcriptional repressor LexA [Patescibacteria group bacterium]|jgi:repressor LexA
MENLFTKKQKLVLSAIKNLTHKLGRSPTLDEVRESLDYGSVSAVQRHTDALKEKGYLDNNRDLVLPDSVATAQIPLVGNVAAGTPFLAVENIEAYIAYDPTSLKGSPDDYFFLRAVGNSMNNASVSGQSIDDGDYVLVKKNTTADFGERIVALIGDDATIKKLDKKDNHVVLTPETTDSKNKPIFILNEEDFLIQGVVVGVIKEKGT